MKALIADKLEASAVEQLRTLCDEVVVDPSLNGDALAEACADAEILIVRSTEVRAPVLARARRLSLIVRAGAGVNTIDVAEAARRGIFVANCPGKNALAVAELAMGLLLALDRRIPDNVSTFRQGRWDKKAYSAADGLAGRTLGVVGLGTIGRAFAKRALAFDTHVLAWSRSLTDEAARALGVERAPDLATVFSRADAVSLHLAQTPDTKGLVTRDLLMAMKPGAILLNTARAGLVDEAALLEAVEARGLRVGLDVIADEPADKQAELRTPLTDHPRVYVTHHIGASTAQAQAAVADEVVRIVRAFSERGEVPGCVNLRARPDATHQLMVRHEDRVGVLAGILGALSQHGLNVDEMTNLIFQGEEAACCFIQLASAPTPEVVAAVEALPHVLSATAHD